MNSDNLKFSITFMFPGMINDRQNDNNTGIKAENDSSLRML